jgi:hypothetical protein
VAHQLHSCCSKLLEPCVTESSTLDHIHPKPWNLCSDTSRCIKYIYISNLGGMHTNNKKKKPRTQDFTWFNKSLHPRSAPALNSHYSINEYNSEELYSFKFTNSY